MHYHCVHHCMRYLWSVTDHIHSLWVFTAVRKENNPPIIPLIGPGWVLIWSINTNTVFSNNTNGPTDTARVFHIFMLTSETAVQEVFTCQPFETEPSFPPVRWPPSSASGQHDLWWYPSYQVATKRGRMDDQKQVSASPSSHGEPYGVRSQDLCISPH